MKKLPLLLSAVLTVKMTLIGISTYLPKDQEAVQLLKETKGQWSCAESTTPTLKLVGTGLFVACIPNVASSENKQG